MTHPRRLVCDIIDMARRMPLAPLERTIDVSEVQHWRRQIRPRPAWPVIMMRAYALAAVDNPLMRRVYVPLPWQRYYEHHESTCLLTIQREFRGEPQLIFARFTQPENFTLAQLQERYDRYRRSPLDEFRHLRHQFRFSRLPWLFRRLGWGLMTGWMPITRAKQMGTFGMSLSGLGDTTGTFHLGPCTTTLGFDQMCRGGRARLTLTFDHRVLDGKPAMDILEAVRQRLHDCVCQELKRMARRQNGTIRRYRPGAVVPGEGENQRAA